MDLWITWPFYFNVHIFKNVVTELGKSEEIVVYVI